MTPRPYTRLECDDAKQYRTSVKSDWAQMKGNFIQSFAKIVPGLCLVKSCKFLAFHSLENFLPSPHYPAPSGKPSLSFFKSSPSHSLFIAVGRILIPRRHFWKGRGRITTEKLDNQLLIEWREFPRAAFGSKAWWARYIQRFARILYIVVT